MSQADRVQQQIFAAVAKSGLQHKDRGDVLRVLAPPLEGQNQSTEVLIRCAENHNDSVVVYLFSPVVIKLPEDDTEVQMKAHLICNSLNQEQVFGRWVYFPDKGYIAVEHELVGDDLDPSEILGAIVTVGHSADQWDDEIQEDLGAGELMITMHTDDDVVE